MSEQLAQQFIDALHDLEERGDLDTLVAQYTEDATLTNVNLPEPMTGTAGVRKFWEDYRSLFSQIHSEFSHVVVQGNEAALEWTGTGTLASNGEPIEYDGVTMLTFRDGKVSAFRGYYDQIALTQRVAV